MGPPSSPSSSRSAARRSTLAPLSVSLALLATAATAPSFCHADFDDVVADLLTDALSSVLSSTDVQLDASIAAHSDTDLNITAALLVSTSADVSLNFTISLEAQKCDVRNMRSTVAVDLITPDYFTQALCWLIGGSCADATVTTNLYQETLLLQPEGGWGALDDEEVVNFEVDLSAFAEDGEVMKLTFGDVKPMFTGLSFHLWLNATVRMRRWAGESQE
jgi:hypothetical protein